MKILVFSHLAAVWRPRLPTLLSVIQTHLDAGDDVVVVSCSRSVPACTANFDGSAAICAYCIAKKDKGLALLDGEVSERLLEDYLDPAEHERLLKSDDSIRTLDDLRTLKHGAADIGYAAYSTYAYVSRRAEPDLGKPAVARAIQSLANAGKIAFESARAAIAAERPDRVIIHHGRGPMDRGVLRASQASGVDCWIYETALSLDRLLLFQNALPHDIEAFKRRVDEQWDAGGEDRERIGAAFFEMRRSGQRKVEAEGVSLETQDRPFVSRQEHGRLPENWDPGKKNIVIYGSSNDEFIAISPDYEERMHPSQIDALERLSTDLAGQNVHLWFRVHPRQKGVRDEYIAALTALGEQRENVTVVPAEAPISSYALLDNAAVVVAFLSTMSIEAAFWGKPSIIISASIYKPMGASYVPESHEELLALLKADLPPKDRLPSLKFGYYQMTSGIEQKYYGGDLGKGKRGYTFRGDPILMKGLSRWRYFWARERQRLKWRKLV